MQNRIVTNVNSANPFQPHMNLILNKSDELLKTIIQPNYGSYIAIIDTETGDTIYQNDTLVSFGIIILNPMLQVVQTFYSKVKNNASYIMYEKGLYMGTDTPVCTTNKAIDIIHQFLKHYRIQQLMAYNAPFDRNVLQRNGLSRQVDWFDLMPPARNIQTNRHITPDMKLFSTGNLRKGYSVDKMLKYVLNVSETHNAMVDALDESLILLDLCQTNELAKLIRY